MSPGPHVFGDNRRGLWVAENSSLTDKLKHYLPRLRAALPGLTDIFLPPSAEISHKAQVKEANFFSHLYVPPPHGKTAKEYAQFAVARHNALKLGALELNIEGVLDERLSDFVTAAVAEVRRTKKNLPLRINVVPWKGQYLPAKLFDTDPQLYVIAQAYGGNMDELYASDEVLMNLLDWGLPREKASIMHAVMCEDTRGTKRWFTAPHLRKRGAWYIDDLVLDAGLL